MDKSSECSFLFIVLRETNNAFFFVIPDSFVLIAKYFLCKKNKYLLDSFIV